MPNKFQEYFYFVFRVLVGLLFLQHGGQKLFGWFGGLGGNTAELVSLMGLAGIIELIGGLAIVLGLFTRLTALIAAVEMIVALFMAHFPKSIFPILNGGESAALFFASFLVLLAYGAGKWSLGRILFKKEVL
ncbi:MAG: DoxX family protein [Nanoarchaeota archaeon]